MFLCQSGPEAHHAHESSGRYVGGGGSTGGGEGGMGVLTPPNLCLGDHTQKN